MPPLKLTNKSVISEMNAAVHDTVKVIFKKWKKLYCETHSFIPNDGILYDECFNFVADTIVAEAKLEPLKAKIRAELNEKYKDVLPRAQIEEWVYQDLLKTMTAETKGGNIVFAQKEIKKVMDKIAPQKIKINTEEIK